MRAGRRILIRRTLALSARRVASRFARHAFRLRLRRAWHALALRWRRNRIRPRVEHARAAAASVNAVWHSPIHLHFSLHAHDRMVPAGRTPAQRAATSPDVRRLIADRYHPTIRSAAHVVPEPRASRAQRVLLNHGPAADRRLGTRQALAAAASSRRIPAISSRIENRTRPQRHSPVHIGKRTAIERAERPLSLPTLKSRGGTQTQVLRSRALTRRHAMQQLLPDLPAARPPLSHRTELVWRSAPQSSARDIEDAPQRTPPARADRTVTEPIATTVATRAAFHPADRAVLEVTHLAPSLVDRLADDVIRRVERRVRIDRERRGL